MRSPFPGMDPFLEGPDEFPDLHQGMIVIIQMTLQPRLPEAYYAATNSRIWVEDEHRIFEPDVDVQTRKIPPQGDGSAILACKTRSAPLVVPAASDPIEEIFLDILHKEEDGPRLVASIEILRRSNKSTRSRGRRLYKKKQREMLGSNAHFIEIDLLRAGKHTTAAPLSHLRERAGTFDYHVCLTLGDAASGHLVYAFLLQEPLPEIAVPLLPGDPAIPLDLQTVFERAYETGAYPRRVRYDRLPPKPALSAEQTTWMQNLLREQGLVAAS